MNVEPEKTEQGKPAPAPLSLNLDDGRDIESLPLGSSMILALALVELTRQAAALAAQSPSRDRIEEELSSLLWLARRFNRTASEVLPRIFERDALDEFVTQGTLYGRFHVEKPAPEQTNQTETR